jgi:hypothetical protein
VAVADGVGRGAEQAMVITSAVTKPKTTAGRRFIGLA